MTHNPSNCPVSTKTPPAQVDDDGFCSEHGWECDDFALEPSAPVYV
jgi:hypothetical protein